jgi:hypothetical protein
MHIDSASFWHATMGVTCSGITLCDSYSIVSATQPMYGDDAKFEGQISGYSHGQVVNTCTSVLQGGTSRTLLCQYEAYYTSVADDSGGPVVTGCGSPCYFTDYNPVRAMGQSVGHNSTYTFLGQFSWIGMVYNELGQGAGGTGLRLTRY